MRIVPGDHCLVDEGVLASVVAIDQSIFIIGVKLFSDCDQLLILVTGHVDKSVLDVIELSFGLQARSECVAGSTLNALDYIDKRAGSHVVRTASFQLIVRFSSP